jgi:inosine/uridine nucleosidase
MCSMNTASKKNTASRKILIDCDPGHDDAVAILLAAGHPDVDLVGITTVAGNHTIERVTTNACVVATIAGLRDVPVVAGGSGPLVRDLRIADSIHGQSGLDGPAPIEPTVRPTAGHAVDFIIDTVLAQPGQVTLVALGPLTNVAMALRKAPELARAVDRVSIMGGSWSRGNMTPVAEFNVWVDPEAAAVVFGAPWDLTMVGLDVTHQALFTAEVAARFESLVSPAARWLGELMAFYRETNWAVHQMGAPPVHDPCALAAVIDPSIVPTREASVDVETTGTHTAGMTVVDFNRRAAAGAHHVGVGLEAEAFWTLLHRAVAALPLPALDPTPEPHP